MYDLSFKILQKYITIPVSETTFLSLGDAASYQKRPMLAPMLHWIWGSCSCFGIN